MDTVSRCLNDGDVIICLGGDIIFDFLVEGVIWGDWNCDGGWNPFGELSGVDFPTGDPTGNGAAFGEAKNLADWWDATDIADMGGGGLPGGDDIG